MARSKQGEENRKTTGNVPSEAAIIEASRELAGTGEAGEASEAYGIASGDDKDAARVAALTTTRERQARAVRAHEPLVPTGEEQPAEDTNGPRLPAVHGAEVAKVLDPGTDTSSMEYPVDPAGGSSASSVGAGADASASGTTSTGTGSSD